MAGVTPQRNDEPAPAIDGEGCSANVAASNPPASQTPSMQQPGLRALPVVWQRLVKDDQTCERCGATHQELLAALAQIEPALLPLGLRPVLQTVALDEAAFKADPSASNRVWIGGRSLEDWLGARSGSSPCCAVCGDLPCRTLEVAGCAFDAVPRHLIVKAALIAAAAMIEPSRTAAGPASCCASESASTSGCGKPCS